jgi:hypothetical protein
MEETPDISTNNYAVKTGIRKLDIGGKLVYKDIVHGQFFLKGFV